MKILHLFSKEQLELLADADVTVEDRDYYDREIEDMYAAVVQFYHLSGNFDDEIIDKAATILDVFENLYPNRND